MVLLVFLLCLCFFFFFKQKTAYEMRISDWSSDVCSSDLRGKRAVFTCVGADADLQQVVLGKDVALAAMRPGAVLVDHTTVSAKIARRLAEEAASKGLLAVDAPVSGGQAGAASGQLAIMCGGSAEIGRAHV